MATIRYFQLEVKTYLETVPVMANFLQKNQSYRTLRNIIHRNCITLPKIFRFSQVQVLEIQI